MVTRQTTDYRLPDGSIVAIYSDVAKAAFAIDFTLKGGKIVTAFRETELMLAVAQWVKATR